MKIIHKFNLANITAIVIILLTGFFALSNLNLVLAKLRFVEIADDLNTSFLMMRLAEKNYFLYGDRDALAEIDAMIANSSASLKSVDRDVIKAIGALDFKQLGASLDRYRRAVDAVRASGKDSPSVQVALREAGQDLREFSAQITHVERQKVNAILSGAKKKLLFALGTLLLCAVGISYLIFFNILGSLKKIMQVVSTIAAGNFGRVGTAIPRDELGMVMTAINTMVKELEDREEQIIQSKKLASIGILTAGVAHELGNPLNNISMIAQTYAAVYPQLSDDERLDYMQKVEEETQRIKHIVDNLLDFSKPKASISQPGSLNDIVRRSLGLVHNTMHICNVEARTVLDPDLPQVLMDAEQILEVVINLLTNALQACSAGDHLTIRTTRPPGGNDVELTIADTGKGIPPELQAHIFDPFFSTKGTAGTGLGLFVSYGIIKNHQGTIKVDSEEGKGTCFTIDLPIYTPGKEESRHDKTTDNGH